MNWKYLGGDAFACVELIDTALVLVVSGYLLPTSIDLTPIQK